VLILQLCHCSTLLLHCTHTALRYIATGIRAGGASRQSAALALRSCCAACEKWIVLDIGAIEALLPLLSVAQVSTSATAMQSQRCCWPFFVVHSIVHEAQRVPELPARVAWHFSLCLMWLNVDMR
jgi:hypothetical protein